MRIHHGPVVRLCASLITAAVLLACDSAAPTTPAPRPADVPTIPPPNPPVIVAVALAAPAGHSLRFTPGVDTQLEALATLDDGSTADCTSTAVWRSSDEAIATFVAGSPGKLRPIAAGAAQIRATCGSIASRDLNVTVQRGVRIGGFERYRDFVTLNSSVELTATIINADGSVYRDCTREAVWTSSQPDIAEIRDTLPSMPFLVQHEKGAVVLTAQCATGASGQRAVAIDDYVLRGMVTADGVPVPGVRVGRVQTDAGGVYETVMSSDDFVMRVAKVGFEPVREDRKWNRQDAQRIDYALASVPGIIAQREGQLARGADETLTFTAPRPGTLRVLGYWDAPGGSGIDRDIYSTLRCNGRQMYQGDTGDGWGTGFSIAANPACQYELVIRNDTTLPVLPYQLTVSVQ